MKNKRKWFLFLVFSVPLVIIFSQCLSTEANKPDPRGDIFAGSASCMQCHKNVYDSYVHTAHFTTTQPSSQANINGSFNSNANTFYFTKDIKTVMQKRDNGLYQVSYLKGQEAAAERFDITFGGVKAESYLYWKGDGVYQLPMSYFKALHSWTNSPGFDVNKPDYTRSIGRRCFECHSSYIKKTPQQTQNLTHNAGLDKNSLIYGIDCERCHGPGANHVNFHLAYPEEKKAKYIRTYASLTRSEKMDLCATCHSGNKSQMIRSTFTFKPGDKLADFKEITFAPNNVDTAKLDVHGNQAQLLASSKCFIGSKMECATCHDVHKSEAKLSLAMYSAKCVTCHSNATHNECKLTGTIAMIKNNCIDCHMPAKQSNVIRVQTSGGSSAIPYLVRTHHIAIYKDGAATVTADLKKYNLTAR